MKSMQKNIGLRLKEERERMGLSQVAMGEIANVDKYNASGNLSPFS